MMVVAAILSLLVQDLLLAADGQDCGSWSETSDNRFGISQCFFNRRNDFGGGYVLGNGTFVSDASLLATAATGPRFGPGPGFAGAHVAAAVAMHIHHRYRQYLALVSPDPDEWLGREGGVFVVAPLPCLGGCPKGSFCDYGMCRCLEGFKARFGACFPNFAIAFAKS